MYLLQRKTSWGNPSALPTFCEIPSVNPSGLNTAPDPVGTLGEACNRGSQPGNQLWNLLCMKLKALNHSCYMPKLICPWCIAMQCDNKIIQCTCSADVTMDWVDDNLHKSSRSFDDGLQVNNQFRTNTTINKAIWIVFKLVSWYELNSHWHLKVCIS